MYYVPIYFSLFPLRELNRDLSTYLGEDYFVGSGDDLSDAEVDALQKRINRIGIVSMAIAVVRGPWRTRGSTDHESVTLNEAGRGAV